MGSRTRFAGLFACLAGATLAAIYACGDPYSEGEQGVDAGGPAVDAAVASDADASSPTDASGAPDTSDASADGSAYRAAVLASGPVAYWRLGEASGVNAKDEIGGNDCIYQGAITLGAAGALTNDPNTSIHGEGTNGSVQCGDIFDFAGNVPFSVEAWVKPDIIDNDYRRVIAKRANSGDGWAIYCHSNSSGCVFELLNNDSGIAPRTCAVTLPVNVYIHLVATYDTATMRMYLNGVEACNNPSALTMVNHAAPLVIGAYSSGGNNFKGNLDEIALYDKVLDAATVKAHYEAR